MNPLLSLIPLLLVGFVVGLVVYRWGFEDGRARGRLESLSECNDLIAAAAKRVQHWVTRSRPEGPE